MEKEFVSYNLALRMKQLGFDEPCMTKFVDTARGYRLDILPPIATIIDGENGINAPTWNQAFRWFREKHGLYSYVYTTLADIKLGDPIYGFSILDLHTKEYKYPKYQSKKNTHEEAELACLEQLIEIAEQKHKENTRSMNNLIESNKKFDEQQKLGKNDRDSYEGGFDFGMWLSTIQ